MAADAAPGDGERATGGASVADAGPRRVETWFEDGGVTSRVRRVARRQRRAG